MMTITRLENSRWDVGVKKKPNYFLFVVFSLSQLFTLECRILQVVKLEWRNYESAASIPGNCYPVSLTFHRLVYI